MRGTTKRVGGEGGGCAGHEHTQAGRQAGTEAGNDPNPSRPIEPRQDRRQE